MQDVVANMVHAKSSDIVIVSTVRSWYPRSYEELTDDEWEKKQLKYLEHNEFFLNPGRALGAISRAVHAFFLIGNMRVLERNEMWKRFLLYAVGLTPIVTVDYLRFLQMPASAWHYRANGLLAETRSHWQAAEDATEGETGDASANRESSKKVDGRVKSPNIYWKLLNSHDG